MPFSFFGLVLKPHKTYTQKVSRPFRVTMATYGEKVTEGDRSCVKVAIDGETYVLCALSAPRVEQQPLDVVFEVNDEITFSSSGQNIIYLTGNYLPDENDDESDSEDMESEDLDSDECEDDIVSDEEISDDMLKSLRAAIGQDASSDSDEDDEDDPDFVELEAEDDDGEDSSSDISEVEDEDEEGDSDKAKSDDAMDLGGEEESTGVATGSKRKAAQKSPQQSEKKLKDNAAAAIPASSAKSPAKNVEKPDVAAPLASVADTESTPKITLQDKTSEKKVPQSAPPKTAAAAGTPSRQVDVPPLPNTEQKTKRQRKAERKKAKMDAMAEAGKASVTAGDKQNKNEKTTPVSPKSTADSGVATEDVKSGNGVIAAKNSKTPKKTFDNGLVVEDVKVGNGAVAAKGKKVTVRYIGKLVKNGKVFDKNVNGKPFSFVLGQGEVIKGWDLGFENMKVGGERRLIIPGPLAYGARGAPPDIPKNAALEFEVKLLKVD